MTTADDEPAQHPYDRAGAGLPTPAVVGSSVDLTARPARTVRTLIPILSWLPRYDWGKNTARDLVAGIALAALLIPESLGYAGVAGVPAELGLYAALAAIIGYALTGGTSTLVVGPASGVAALTASIIAELGGDADPVVLAAALATTSSVILVVTGIVRLGWIVNFISRPVLEAFVAGLCISTRPSPTPTRASPRNCPRSCRPGRSRRRRRGASPNPCSPVLGEHSAQTFPERREFLLS